MAFTDDKYHIQFIDGAGVTHTFKFFLDGYTGSSTELTGTEDPVTLLVGSSGGDEYRPIMESVLEMDVIVDDDTVSSDIFGDDEQSWVVDWVQGSTLVWRGYLLTDDIEQPLDTNSVLRLRAVCGLAFLDSVQWTPATSGRQTFMDAAQDALNDLNANGDTLDGLAIKIGAAANWHAYDGGSAVTGNSFARYELDEKALEDEQTGNNYTNRFVLGQITGRFGAKLTMANGRWRFYQRDLMDAASYSMDKYTIAGVDEASDETISEVEITTTTNPILEGGYVKGLLGYKSVPITYAHGHGGGSLFSNSGFEVWASGDAAPAGWTRVRENTEVLTRVTGGAAGGGRAPTPIDSIPPPTGGAPGDRDEFV